MVAPTHPGWYPDPAGPGGRRYWDGYAWHDAIPARPGPVTPKRKTGGHARWWIVLGVVVAGLVILAVSRAGTTSTHNPIPPGASERDKAFLRAMDSRDITNENGSQMLIDYAHDVCDMLDGGYTVNGLAKHAALLYNTLDGDDWRYFVETAATAYCPRHVN